MRKHLFILLFAVALFLGLTAAALADEPKSLSNAGVAMKGAVRLAYYNVAVNDADYSGYDEANVNNVKYDLNGWTDRVYALTLPCAKNVHIAIQDYFWAGDYYEVWVDGVLVYTTPQVPIYPESGHPVSSGSVDVPMAAGTHLIEVRDAFFDDPECDMETYPLWNPAALNVAWQLSDVTPPVMTCPPDVTIGNTDPSDPDHTGWATAVDECSGDGVQVWSEDKANLSQCGVGVIERTWYAVDGAGNRASCVQVITIVDVVKPEIACPRDVVIECDAPRDPDHTGWAKAWDDCDGELVPTFSDTAHLDGCDGSGYIERTWYAKDAAGNTSSCVQKIGVVDTKPPMLMCPPNLTLECGMPTDPSATGFPSVYDCDPNPWVGFYDVVIPNPHPSDKFVKVIARIWAAKDHCGNGLPLDIQGTAWAKDPYLPVNIPWLCVQFITVVDTTAPVIVITAPVDGACYQVAPDPAFTVTDACTQVCQKPVKVESGVESQGCYFKFWVTAVDYEGNMSQAEVEYMVDAEPPVVPTIIAPADGATYTSATVPAPSFSATDACDPNPVVTQSGYSTAEGVHTMIVTAADCAGNQSQASVTYTVDNTPPDINFELTAGQCYAVMPLCEDLFSVDDNLDENVEVKCWITGGPCEYMLHVEATDNAGNVASATMAFVVDGEAPVVVISAPDGCFTTEDVPVAAYVVTDNCDPAPVVVVTGYSTAEGVQTMTVTATDCAGNVGSDSITYIVDNTAPEAAITAPLDGDWLKGAVSIEGSFSDINLVGAELSINGEVVATALPFLWDTTAVDEYGYALYPDGDYTIALKVVDCAGNETVVEILVHVDNSVPAPPVTVELDAPILGAGQEGEVTLAGLAEDNSRLQLWIKGPGDADFEPIAWFWADACGHWQYTLAALEPGIYVFKVGSYDLAGNWTWGREFQIEIAAGRGYETWALQEGVVDANPTDGLIEFDTETWDTWIGEWEPGANAYFDTRLKVRYGAERSALVKFDTSVLPANVQIELATLGLYSTVRSNINPMELEVYNIKADWVEDEATYTKAAIGADWDAPGANGAADRELIAADSTWAVLDESWYAFDVTDEAAEWYATPASNKGVLVKGTADISVEYDFASSEHPEICRRPIMYVIVSTGTPLALAGN